MKSTINVYKLFIIVAALIGLGLNIFPGLVTAEEDLGSGHRVSGSVTFGTAQNLEVVSTDIGLIGPDGTFSATTDIDGNYSIANVPNGSYTISLRQNSDNANTADRFFPAMNSSTNLVVQGNDVHRDINFKTSTADVYVYDTDGTPRQFTVRTTSNPQSIVNGSTGTIRFDTTEAVSNSQNTDSDGRAKFTVLSGLEYQISHRIVINPDRISSIAQYPSADGYGSLDSKVIKLYLGTWRPTVNVKEFTSQYPELTWTPVVNANSYNIYRNDIKIGATTDTSYIDHEAPEGFLIKYSVSAVLADGSEPSQISTSTVQAHIDRTAPVFSNLHWTQSNTISSGETATFSVQVLEQQFPSVITEAEYFIGDDPGYGNGSPLNFPENARDVTLSATVGNDLSAGVHPVVIRVTDTAGNRGTITAHLNVLPKKPINLSAPSPSRQAVINWTPVPDANGYKIYHRVNCCQFVVVGTSSEATFTHANGPEGWQYYQVTSVKDGIESPKSEQIGTFIDRTAPVIESVSWEVNPISVSNTTQLHITYSAGTDIVSGEMYTGDDPGVGSGTPIASTGTSGRVTSGSVGADLGIGVYTVGVRLKDQTGNWSVAATTLLTVYDPSSTLLVTGKNKKDLVPNLVNGDKLPGLLNANQTDVADYGFTVEYKQGALDPNNDFALMYNTGPNCKKKGGQNCHTFRIDAVSFDWLVVDQNNNSHGRFQGMATVENNGTITTNPFTVEITDGDRLEPASGDKLIVKVYSPGSNPANADSLYQVTGLLDGGNNVKIQ